MTKSNKQQPDWYTEEQRFVFPAGLATGNTFNTVEQIQDLIDREATRTKYHAGTKGYKLRYEIKDQQTGEWRRLRFICNICEAQLNFIREGDEIMTMKINVNHVHGPVQAEKREKELEYKRNYMKMRKRDRSQRKKSKGKKESSEDESEPEVSPVKSKTTKLSENISSAVDQQMKVEEDDRRVTQNGQWRSSRANQSSTPEKSGYPHQPNKTTSELELWLIQHEYNFLLDWTNEENQKRPQTLLIVSKTMKKNFLAYSDMLSFEVIYDLVRNTSRGGKSYLVGVFTVADTNSKSLIAGLAIFSNDTIATFKEIFQKLVEVHWKKHPQTIITSDSSNICQAVAELRNQKKLQSDHLVNSWHLTKGFLQKLNGSSSEIARIAADLQTAVQQRDRRSYDRLVNSLKAYCEDKGLLQDFIRLEQLGCFYLTTGNAFVGLARSNSQELMMLIHNRFPKKLPMRQFLQNFHEFHEELSERSLQNFDMHFQGVSFLDSKLDELLVKVESEVAKRFIENYLKAIQNYALSDASTYHNMVVTHNNSGDSWSVKKLKCTCREFEKTGVACPHLIVATMECKMKDYKTLISGRWIKHPEKTKKHKANE